MAKLKWENFDDGELDGADWDADRDGGFNPYDGPLPPANVVLRGKITKAWSTVSKAGSPMLKILFEASGNEGEKKIYDGLAIWHNVVFMKEYPGLYKPFLTVFKLTAADVAKRTIVDEQDKVGSPVLKIGANFKPGENSSAVTISTKRSTYNDQPKVEIAKFIMPVDSDDEDEFEDDAPF